MFALKPDYEASKQRMDAFWEREILDRPLVQFKLYKPFDEWVDLPSSNHSTWEERWLDVDYQVAWAVADLTNQLFLGDTMPVVWPNLGPDLFSALYGCPLLFIDSLTSWSKPILKDWEQAAVIHLDWNHPYLAKINQITDALLEVGRDRFITGITDLHGGGDALSALRGPVNLAKDLFQLPEQVKNMLARLYADYFALYEVFYQRLKSVDQPITTWTPLVCDGRYYLPSNDFSIMVSNQMYREFFLEGTMEECTFLDHSLYHLDGPGALHHLDCLLEITELDAIQFVPTDTKAEFSRWAPVYRKIQDGGKSLQVTCLVDEVNLVIDSLRPQGVYLVVRDVPSQVVGEMIIEKVERWPMKGYR